MMLTPFQAEFLVAAYVISGNVAGVKVRVVAIGRRVILYPEDPEVVNLRDASMHELEDLEDLGLLKCYDYFPNPRMISVELTQRGGMDAERLIMSGTNPRWREGFDPDYASLGFNGSQQIEADTGSTGYALPVPENIPALEILHSEEWTGRASADVLAGERLDKLKAFLANAESDLVALRIENNSDKAQALALIAALKIVSDAPEPPASAILELLAALNNVAGIGSFLIAVAALMAVLTK